MTELHIRDESELEPLGATLIGLPQTHEGAFVIALTGDLGAGKTALTKAIARTLGINESVTSPTFVIMKSYPVVGHKRFTTLTHIDAYRIEDEAELEVLGIAELLADPHRLLVIEWPERVPGTLPSERVTVSIQLNDDNSRTITYDCR